MDNILIRFGKLYRGMIILYSLLVLFFYLAARQASGEIQSILIAFIISVSAINVLVILFITMIINNTVLKVLKPGKESRSIIIKTNTLLLGFYALNAIVALKATEFLKK